MRFYEQQKDPGRATHPLSLDAPLPGQDASKYKARNVNPTIWNDDESKPISWSWVAVLSAALSVACVGLFASAPVQFYVATAISAVGSYALYRLLWRVS